jgi:hypothetical protein
MAMLNACYYLQNIGFLDIAVSRSKRVMIALSGANSHGLIKAAHKNLAIANLPGPGRGGDRLDGLIDKIGCHRDLYLQFR